MRNCSVPRPFLFGSHDSTGLLHRGFCSHDTWCNWLGKQQSYWLRDVYNVLMEERSLKAGSSGTVPDHHQHRNSFFFSLFCRSSCLRFHRWVSCYLILHCFRLMALYVLSAALFRLLLRSSGSCVAPTAPTGSRLSHPWSSDVTTHHVRVDVFIFLWESHHVVKLGLHSRTPPPLRGNAFFTDSVQQCQIWTQIQPSWWAGVELWCWVRSECACLGMDQTLSRPKVWTDKCDICCTIFESVRMI